MSGGYGILFRSSVYDLFIGELSKEVYLADIVYMKHQPNLKAFRSFVNLALHPPNYSTIKKQNVDYAGLY